MTIVERPWRSSAMARVRPMSPPPRMMTSARSMFVPSNDFPALPMQSCNAKRLTGESRRAHCPSRNIWGTGMAASAAQSARQLRLAQWRTGMKRGMRRSWALLIGGAHRRGGPAHASGAGQLPADRPLAQHRRRRTGQELGRSSGRVERRPSAQPVRAARRPCSSRSSLLIGIRIATGAGVDPLAALARPRPCWA